MAGESVDVNEQITHTFHPMTKEQQGLKFTFFASQSKNPRYVDESRVEELGSLEVDISSTVGQAERPVEVSLSFGKTEIAVEAKDIKTNKTYNTKLRFSSTYSIE